MDKIVVSLFGTARWTDHLAGKSEDCAKHQLGRAAIHIRLRFPANSEDQEQVVRPVAWVICSSRGILDLRVKSFNHNIGSWVVHSRPDASATKKLEKDVEKAPTYRARSKQQIKPTPSRWYLGVLSRNTDSMPQRGSYETWACATLLPTLIFTASPSTTTLLELSQLVNHQSLLIHKDCFSPDKTDFPIYLRF
ncbi:unnamed protein product [Dibothriocephalus latus]|uniref:Uncharacterized protein n=1 Tax=Dibothriocephalus latus TaxID=60516 RepID=A0A3P7LE38_DIBLA|nr:unnamed protein product [Dibothriocephalus latus]